MKRFGFTTYFFLYVICCLVLAASTLQAQTATDPLMQTIKLPRINKTIYQLLDIVSEKSGYFFIYDSNLLNNEQKAYLPKGTYTIREAISRAINNDQLEIKIIEDHIMISAKIAESDSTINSSNTQVIHSSSNKHFIIEGVVLDKGIHQPLEAATIGIKGNSIGTISNANGEFRLTLPDSLSNDTISISHVGYLPVQLPCSMLSEKYTTIALDQQIIPIQEVIIRIINPLRLLRDVESKREENYIQQPFYITAFYREGIERKNEFIGLTEAVFKIYKSGYNSRFQSDHVKLLKMRKISNDLTKDTLITKMKSGINACLMLDLMNNMSDFLQPEEQSLYNYTSTDLTLIEGRLAQVISFEQRSNISEPLYKGDIYIDSENHALLHIRFELNPLYIKKAVNMLVERKSKNINIIPQKVIYSVSYKSDNDRYYVNHVRGDLYFKIKKKKQVFKNTTTLHTWFEMVSGKIETNNVSRFSRKETVSTRTIFSETAFSYDTKFWDNFNFILPEEQLNEAISKIKSKIEETNE